MSNPTLDNATYELGEIAEYRKVFRRLAAATVLEAIADLSSSDKLERYEAAYYLTHDGAGLLKALGIRCEKLDEIISNPPQKRALKCSNGRKERKFIARERILQTETVW